MGGVDQSFGWYRLQPMATSSKELGKLCDWILLKLSHKSRWTTGAYARLANGLECHPTHSKAHAFSVDGAIEAADGPLWAKSLLEENLRKLARKPLPVWNDSVGYGEMVAVLRRAVQATFNAGTLARTRVSAI